MGTHELWEAENLIPAQTVNIHVKPLHEQSTVHAWDMISMYSDAQPIANDGGLIVNLALLAHACRYIKPMWITHNTKGLYMYNNHYIIASMVPQASISVWEPRWCLALRTTYTFCVATHAVSGCLHHWHTKPRARDVCMYVYSIHYIIA